MSSPLFRRETMEKFAPRDRPPDLLLPWRPALFWAGVAATGRRPAWLIM